MILPFSTRSALNLSSFPINFVLKAVSSGVNRPKHETGHSSRSIVEVKSVKSYPPVSCRSLWCGTQLKAIDVFTFTVFWLRLRGSVVG